LLQGKAELQATYLENDAKIQRQIARANVTLEFENYKKYLQDKLEAVIKITEDTIEQNKRAEGETLEAFGERLVKEGVLQAKRDGEDDTRKEGQLSAYQERLANEAQAYENLTQTKINLEKNYAVQVEEINAGKNEAVKSNDIKTQEEINAERLKLLQDFFSIAQSNLDILAQGTNVAFATTIQSTITAIQGLVDLSQQEFTSTAEKVAAYAQVIGQAINSVVNAFVQQNQAALEQDLQNFEITNNAEKDALTQRYNQGLIDKNAYDAGILASDKKLKSAELAAKKKAFEEDKKLRIVQATIAGLTGAVSAFAGAMTIPPPAGPILGGILAAAVAATTAINIAQIKKQKFDSGGTTVDVSSTQVGGETATQINAASSGGFTAFNEGVTGAPTGTTTTTGANTGMYQKVYVLESDITASQNRVRTLESNASFG
jgi:hypothetical protein